MKKFIDTNVFLRLLTKDEENLFLEAKNIFLDNSQNNLVTSSLVIFEMFWVLKNSYRLQENEWIETLENILKISSLEVENSKIFKLAIEIYRVKPSLGFQDIYNISYSIVNQCGDFESFDKKLKKFYKDLNLN